MSHWVVYGLGFLAQALFSSRILQQWIVSEKHKKILTPQFFWEVSLFASFLLFVYGYLRHDFSIMLGQVFTYYIYIRNMQLQHTWKKIVAPLRYFILIFPIVLIVYSYNNGIYDMHNLLHNKDIPNRLLMFGIFAQVLFTLRFIYQWIYSEKIKESKLPIGFWWLSWFGALSILIYALLRKDPVLFLGHITGITAYTRNIIIHRNEQKQKA